MGIRERHPDLPNACLHPSASLDEESCGRYRDADTGDVKVKGGSALGWQETETLTVNHPTLTRLT